MLEGSPQAMMCRACRPALASRGMATPQAMKATSMLRLMANSPCAACAAERPVTCVSHGPAQSDWTAISPP